MLLSPIQHPHSMPAVQTSLGSDTTRLARVSCSDGSQILEEVAQNPRCDVGGILVDEDTHAVFAVAFNYLRREWLTVDPQVLSLPCCGCCHCHLMLASAVLPQTLPKQVSLLSGLELPPLLLLLCHCRMCCGGCVWLVGTCPSLLKCMYPSMIPVQLLAEQPSTLYPKRFTLNPKP